MNPLQERLQAFLNIEDITVRAFERQCDIKAGTASKMTEKSYGTTFYKIAKAFPQLNIEWLKTGEGEMLNSLSSKPSIDIKDVEDSFNDSNVLDKFLDIIREKDRQIEELNQRIKQLTDKLLGL
ncbi:MAG: hypothetical protein HDS71_07485 [Bacteroidales bacterium]|nr:hypothetical protein [Bacteroidales bacterium]